MSIPEMTTKEIADQMLVRLPADEPKNRLHSDPNGLSRVLGLHLKAEHHDFNSPSRLPPVGCKLVIKVGDSEMLAERTGYIAVNSSKNFKFETPLEYKLDATGDVILGRFFWSYP